MKSTWLPAAVHVNVGLALPPFALPCENQDEPGFPSLPKDAGKPDVLSEALTFPPETWTGCGTGVACQVDRALRP